MEIYVINMLAELVAWTIMLSRNKKKSLSVSEGTNFAHHVPNDEHTSHTELTELLAVNYNGLEYICQVG